MIKVTEKDFVDSLEEYFINKDFISRREIDVGYGVADLVLINNKKINKKNIKKRLSFNQNLKLLNQKYFEILQFIPDIGSKRKPIDIITLLEKTQISKTFLKYNLLKFLEINNFIKQENNNYFYKLNGWIPLVKEIIAVEAKIKDWKSGFFQANRYKSFADIVYLAIPSEISHLISLDLFKKHNVGVITFNLKTNRMDYLFKPYKNRPFNIHKKNLAMEYFWEPFLLKKPTIM